MCPGDLGKCLVTVALMAKPREILSRRQLPGQYPDDMARMDRGMTSDSARLTRLYEKHNRSIRAYCLRRVGNGDASDAVAAVFAVAWRRIGDVPSGDMALPWLYGVARRVVADHHRA